MYKRIAVAVILFWPLLAAADWQLVADTSLGELRLDKDSVTQGRQVHQGGSCLPIQAAAKIFGAAQGCVRQQAG